MHKLCIAIRLALTGIPYRRRPGGTGAGGAEFVLTAMQKGLEPETDILPGTRKRRPGPQTGVAP